MKRRRGKHLTHLQAIERHALRALWERRGVAFSASQYLDLCAKCFNGDMPIEMKDDRGQPVYRVDVRGSAMFAIWSIEHAHIVTFLPCREWVGARWTGKGFEPMEARA